MIKNKIYTYKIEKFLIFITILFSFIQLPGKQHFIVLGAPGSGKGTFAKYYADKYQYVPIVLGDFCRNEIRLKTDLGKRILPLIEKGQGLDAQTTSSLTSDLILKVVHEKKFFILDGFPRSRESLSFLYVFLTKYDINNIIFIHLIAPDQTCLKRILERQICQQCCRNYNKSYVIPKTLNTCDDCKIMLTVRKDDKEDIILKRLTDFHKNIEPLIDDIKKIYKVIEINTDCSIDELKKIYIAKIF